MTLDYSSNPSKISSALTLRSGKSLSDKIRQLGFNLRQERTSSIWMTLQHMDIKMEDNRPSNISIMTPNLNLQQIMYYQPESANEGFSSGIKTYRISNFETSSKGHKGITKITDIEVKSFKPAKQMKFRKKKRRSTIMYKIDEILNRGKEPRPSRDSSEESIILDHEWKEQPERTINDLPENVLQRIFLFFPQKERCLLLSKVCKSWYYILKDPIFWTELEFSDDKVDVETIIEVIKRYPSLRKLKLTSVPDVTNILVEMCRCNHSITHLGVRHCIASSHDFARIIRHVISCCTNLEVLDIKGMRFESDGFYIEVGRLANLRSINLTGNKLLRSQDLITLSVNCRNLRHLRILDVTGDQDPKFSLKDHDISFIISHLQRNLETLKLDMQQLGDISYQTIIRCSGLRCLAMKNCLLLSSDMFLRLPALLNLKKLKITRAINLTPDDFEFVFDQESMKDIRHLDINGCWGVGEIGIQAITRRMSSLKSLSLKNCKSIRGNHLKLLSQCPKLKNLNIAHTDVKFDHLLSLQDYAKNLESLVIDLNMCKKSKVRQLTTTSPSLKIIVSFSEYQKDERPLNIKESM